MAERKSTGCKKISRKPFYLILAAIFCIILIPAAALTEKVETPESFINRMLDNYKEGLKTLRNEYQDSCVPKGKPWLPPQVEQKEAPRVAGGDQPDITILRPGESEYEVVSVNNLSGVNPMNFTSVNNWLAGIQLSSSAGSTVKSGGGGGGWVALAASWGSVSGINMAYLQLGSSSTLTSGSLSSGPNLAFINMPGSGTYGVSPQGGYYWCDTGMTNTRNRALGTTNTDNVRVGGAGGITYIVTHTATAAGPTVSNITQ
jgi:hypothetical protein